MIKLARGALSAMRCPECDFDNSEDSRVCTNCGIDLAPQDETRVRRTQWPQFKEGLTLVSTVTAKYRIIGELGKGGMAMVYKAEDIKLRRIVALKLLWPELTRDDEVKERFMREAQAVSALDHANICTIYEIDETKDGQMFIVMSHYEGVTLREKIKDESFSSEAAVDIAIQIACGLAEAHEKGIVHRDIKPGNIMLTAKGQVKIMDFGLAKLLGRERITDIGVPMGTVAYMSPEQARGKGIDQRTDIWSLGVLLYEMITGELPFKGENAQAIIHLILNTEPEPVTHLRPDAPKELESVISRALCKPQDSRYMTALEILKDLRSLRGDLQSRIRTEQPPGRKPQASIAVLPFSDLSAAKDQEYLCDGMAETIINALAHVEGLRVAARTSSFALRERAEDIRDLGRKLNVEKLLEGSVQKVGNRLRITTQLVNIDDGYHLWSEKFDRDMKDIFTVQDEIALAIVDELKIKILRHERAKLLKRHTEDHDAYNLYLRGRWFWNKRTVEDLKKAIEHFRKAIEKDKGFALAYVGLADSYNDLPNYSSLRPAETYPKAKEAVLSALDIDETLADAHASLGLIRTDHEWDWAGAASAFKRSLELNSGYPTAHHWYAMLLLVTDCLDESVKEIKLACDLDPLSLAINRDVGGICCYAGQYDEALTALERTIEMDPQFPFVHFILGLLYLQMARYEESVAEFRKEQSITRSLEVIAESWTGIALALMGKTGLAKELLNDLTRRPDDAYVSSYHIGLLCFALGDIDKGFGLLGKAYDERDIWLRYIKAHGRFPMMDNVRSDPRYEVLLTEMDLKG
jgi:serine/threonine protein kinase/tetratricopeptide (TPR) repeat protein